MVLIVELIDRVINNYENSEIIDSVKIEVNKLMKGRSLFN